MRVFRSDCYAGWFNKCDTRIFPTSSLGCSAFARMYPDGGGDGLYQTIWKPAFEAAFARWAERLRASGLQQIVSMDGDASDLVWLERVTASTLLDYVPTIVGYFPGNLPGNLRGPGNLLWELNQILILNAWDPWSFAGNGNASDPTLDGFIGRQTAVSVLAWPVTNKYLSEEQNVIEVEAYGGVDADVLSISASAGVGESVSDAGAAGPASQGRKRRAGVPRSCGGESDHAGAAGPPASQGKHSRAAVPRSCESFVPDICSGQPEGFMSPRHRDPRCVHDSRNT